MAWLVQQLGTVTMLAGRQGSVTPGVKEKISIEFSGNCQSATFDALTDATTGNTLINFINLISTWLAAFHSWRWWVEFLRTYCLSCHYSRSYCNHCRVINFQSSSLGQEPNKLNQALKKACAIQDFALATKFHQVLLLGLINSGYWLVSKLFQNNITFIWFIKNSGHIYRVLEPPVERMTLW